MDAITDCKSEGTLHYFLENVLSCPNCQQTTLDGDFETIRCTNCGWTSSKVHRDTFSFAPVVYDSARERTRRGSVLHSSPETHRDKFKALVKRAIPWRKWILKDLNYWREAIAPLRQEELRKAQEILVEIIPKPKPVLLELGVGYQNHVDLYHQFARSAICSDIYRDPWAADLYNHLPWILYCLINVEKLPIRESSIDILFSSHVVEHFPYRKDNLNALHRALKPNAIACHIVPISLGFLLGHLVGTMSNLLTLTPRIGRGVHGEFDSGWQELQQTTVRYWRKLFEGSGFEIIQESPGTLGLTPLRPRFTLWVSKTFRIYGSWIFVMRTVK
jgi:hypothetical protein